LAHYVYKNAYLSVGGTNISGDVEELSVNREQELQDDTCMGDTFRNKLGGLQNLELEVTLHNDYVDDGLDEDLEALIGTTFAVAYRPDAGAISTSNPEYQFTGVLGEGGSGGTVGEIDKKSITLTIASGTLTRDVTP
jgi:hypothetical protein